ncbi:MAG: sulfotransferase family protein [Promethearchaeota archaeon]
MRKITDSKLERSDKALPNFFCIGVKRGGTTWLYEILKDHPEVYLCPFKKETHFFTVYYKNGINWYKQFFPEIKKAQRYKIIGEIAPTYFTNKITPKLIKKHIPYAKFILILRDPIKRLISNYNYDKLNLGFNYNFEEYIIKRPIEKFEVDDPIKRGYYSKYLKNWITIFPKENFLILIYEEVMKNKLQYLKLISKFLEIDFKKFKKININKRVNTSNLPKFNKLYSLSFKIYDFFRSKGLYKFINILRGFKPILYILGTKKENKKINNKTISMLYNLYKKDIEILEKLLGINLYIWKNNYINL